ncbi:hypothetical protein [Streptomyces sp. NPDC002078]
MVPDQGAAQEGVWQELTRGARLWPNRPDFLPTWKKDEDAA